MAGHSTLKTFLIAAAAAGLAMAPSAGFAATSPELAQIRRAAEAGDPVAQFTYGERVSNPKDQFTWWLRSAEQGFAPAQDAVGAHFDQVYLSDRKKRPVSIREAVRWTSRAAYQGFPAAQMRLSKFFATGSGVGRDLVIATMWIQIAIDNPRTTFGQRMMASMNRDRLIAPMSPGNITEGQRLAAEFTYLRPGQLNPIEVRLLVASLTLKDIYRRNENVSASVNRLRIRPGETRSLSIDDHSVSLTCLAIDATTGHFRVNGFDTIITLEQRK